MDQLADQLNRVREEMGYLLNLYLDAEHDQQTMIVNRCEELGGQIQELVLDMKLALIDVEREASDDPELEHEEVNEIRDAMLEGLRAVHRAGEETAGAIRLLRELWSEKLSADNTESK